MLLPTRIDCADSGVPMASIETALKARTCVPSDLLGDDISAASNLDRRLCPASAIIEKEAGFRVFSEG